MRSLFGVSAAALALMASLAPAAMAACASGVYRAGCAGPNGAVVVRKHPPAYYHRPPVAVYHHPPAYYHRPPGHVTCASGVYRAGCAGPNGAAVVRRPY